MPRADIGHPTHDADNARISSSEMPRTSPPAAQADLTRLDSAAHQAGQTVFAEIAGRQVVRLTAAEHLRRGNRHPPHPKMSKRVKTHTVEKIVRIVTSTTTDRKRRRRTARTSARRTPSRRSFRGVQTWVGGELRPAAGRPGDQGQLRPHIPRDVRGPVPDRGPSSRKPRHSRPQPCSGCALAPRRRCRVVPRQPSPSGTHPTRRCS